MNSDLINLMSQMIELTKALCELKARAEIAEVKLSGCEDRCKLLLDAKNFWMERAIAAEKQLPNLRNT